MVVDGEEDRPSATGDGPVDAVFNAIRQIQPHDAILQLFQVHAVTEGTDAQAQVTVRLEEGGYIATGHSADTDTLVASAKAYAKAWPTSSPGASAPRPTGPWPPAGSSSLLAHPPAARSRSGDPGDGGRS